MLSQGSGTAAANAAWFKARFFTIARGSTTECAAIVDVLRVRGLTAHALAEHARSLLVRITQMLSKLIARPR